MTGFRRSSASSPQGLAGAVVIAEADPGGAGEHGCLDPARRQPQPRWPAPPAACSAFPRPRDGKPPSSWSRMLLPATGWLPRSRHRAAAPAGASPSPGSAPIVAMGRPCESWREAARSFAEASAALSYRLVAPPGGVFRYGRAREDDPQTLEGLAEQRERTCRAAVAGEAGGRRGPGSGLRGAPAGGRHLSAAGPARDRGAVCRRPGRAAGPWRLLGRRGPGPPPGHRPRRAAPPHRRGGAGAPGPAHRLCRLDPRRAATFPPRNGRSAISRTTWPGTTGSGRFPCRPSPPASPSARAISPSWSSATWTEAW